MWQAYRKLGSKNWIYLLPVPDPRQLLLRQPNGTGDASVTKFLQL